MKTILLDIDDTIFDFHNCAKDSIIKSSEEFGISFSPKMFDRYFEQNWKLWGDYEKGLIERDDIFNIRFPILFAEFNIKADGIEFENAFQRHFMNTCSIVDGANEFIQYLSNKYEVYIVSNSLEKTQRSRLKKAGFDKYFKDIFVSDSVGYQKPTKEFFNYCFDKLKNVNKSQTIIIGDSLSSDIQGGINAGIKTCWFNPNKKVNKTKYKADYEISSLKEIKNIL